MHIRILSALCLAIQLSQWEAAAAPTTTNDAFSTPEDTQLSMAAPGLLANDNLHSESTLVAELLTPPALGGLEITGDGWFIYDPPPNFSGQQTFTYRLVQPLGPTVMDVDSAASILTTTITLETFSVGATQSTLTRTTRAGGSMQVLFTAHQAPFGMIQVQKLDLVGLDAMNGTLCASRVFGNCLATVNLGVPSNSLRVTMNVPESGQAGPAVLADANGVFHQEGNYVNTDGVVNISSAVIPAPPTASLAGTEVQQGFINSTVSQANGILRVAIPVDIPAIFSQSGVWDAPGDYRATVRITGIVYAVAPISTTPATVTLTVTPVDDPPITANDQATGSEMTTVTIPANTGLLSNDADVDGDTLTAEIMSQPQHGRAIVRPDGSFDFTAAPGAGALPDSFCYRVRQNGQPVVISSPLLIEQELWNYYSDSAEPVPGNWQTAVVSSPAWSTGQGPFGYDYEDVSTVLDSGPDALNKTITHYLRKSFQLPVARALASSVTLRVRRDDGVAIWLNGVEVARDNLPGTLGDGLLNSSTLALQDVQHNTGEFITFSIPAVHLRDGENILAVEVHQHSGDSPDLIFNLAADLESYTGAQVQLVVNANDSDTDGMADTWEVANGLNSALNDATADPDGDGKSNLAEFYAGTHPQQATSQLRINQLTQTAGTELDIHFPAVAERRYQLQTSSELTSWSDSGPRWTASPASTSKPPQAHHFYRIRLGSLNSARFITCMAHASSKAASPQSYAARMNAVANANNLRKDS